MRNLIVVLLIAVSCLTAVSQTVSEGNPPTTIIVSSPPVRYGDTVDMTTFVAGEKWHAGALVGNNGTKDLILEKVVSSDPRLRCKVWHDTVPPTYKVSVWGIVKFDKPVGNFKVKTEIFWKGYKNPTVIYFKGNCVEKE